MKAVIYARYSSDNQREESIEGQIRECTAFAEQNGITILRHYIDRAFSAKTDNRPEFQNMIKDSAQGLFDIVLVWKLDRFSRNRYDSAHYKAILKKNNVKVVSATEKISEGSEGILMESILEGFAEYYSADLSEKIVRGMTENALKRKYNGGGQTIGYVIDEEQYFQIDPLSAPLVLEAFKMYDKGATMKEICDWMNGQSFRNSRGNPISFNSVEKLLKNRRYLGIAIGISLYRMASPRSYRRTCLTGYRRGWRRTKSPPPDIRQRMNTYSPANSFVDTVANRWSVRVVRAGTVCITITNAPRSSAS